MEKTIQVGALKTFIRLVHPQVWPPWFMWTTGSDSMRDRCCLMVGSFWDWTLEKGNQPCDMCRIEKPERECAEDWILSMLPARAEILVSIETQEGCSFWGSLENKPSVNP